jgi:hypothetical protein
VFDHVEDQYRIWAIVRYVITKTSDKGLAFEVGVAFIGKRPPASYEAEPSKRYDIAANIFQALTPVEQMLAPLPDVEKRAHTRHNIAVDMRVTILDTDGTVVATEHTVTENISKNGATIFTTLEISVGRFIRITSEQYRLTVHAAIRSRSTGADGVARMHVEFIDNQWPL